MESRDHTRGHGITGTEAQHSHCTAMEAFAKTENRGGIEGVEKLELMEQCYISRLLGRLRGDNCKTKASLGPRQNACNLLDSDSK